jgi:CBS domain-containing protein
VTNCHDPIIERLFLQATVRELNPKPAITIPPTTTVHAAVSEMANRLVGSLLIADVRGLHGILTERDLLTRTAGLDIDLRRGGHDQKPPYGPEKDQPRTYRL